MSKLSRLIRREANRLLAKRRYRERHGGQPAQVWSVRVGPSAPSEKAKKRQESKA